MVSFNTLLNSKYLLVRLRSVVLLIQLAFLNLGHSFDMNSTLQFVLSCSILGTYFGLNFLFKVFPKIMPVNSVQVLLDFAITGSILYLNGGLENPFAFILVIHFLMVPFFLRKMELFVFIALTVIVFGLNLTSTNYLSYHNYAGPDLHIIALITICICTGGLAMWLMKEMNDLNRVNSRLTDFNTKLDRYKALGILAAGVCHELGTPLNTLKFDLDRLEDEIDKEDFASMERSLDKCIASLRKLNLQVHDKENQFYKDSFALARSLKSAIDQFQEHFSLDIEFEFNEIKDVEVELPKILFIRSFVDILENSSEANASKVTVKLEKNEGQGNVVVSVFDNGDGLSQTIISKFGTPFMTSKAKGTGLGLYHLKNLVEIISGSVRGKNWDQGALIEIEMPYKEVELG